MADAAVAAPAGAAPAGQGQAPAQGGVMNLLVRMGLMYLLMTFLRGSGKPKDVSNHFTPFVQKGEAVDMQVYMTTVSDDIGTLLWSEHGLPLAAWPSSLVKSINITEDALAPIINDNATAWLTAIFTRPASEAIESEDAAPLPAKPELTFHVQTQLISHRPPPKAKTGKFLLTASDTPSTQPDTGSDSAPAAAAADADALPPPLIESPEEEEAFAGPPPEPEAWIPYWKPNITIAVVNEFGAHPGDKLPPFFDKHGKLDVINRKYYPVVTLSEFWLLRDYMVPLNASVTNVTLHLQLETISSWYLQMQLAMEQSFEMQQSGGLIQDGEGDELKRIFLEGNPYLLALTTVVSILHSVFDMLAFKNDIGFWKNNKSMEGLSARTIIINAVCQLIIFLYLLDNKTSYVVLFSSGVGTLIEFWKVTKAMNVSVVTTPSGWPQLKMEDRGSYVVSKTKQYDDEAMRYLSLVLFPLIIGYSIYSLMYSEHKSWYSWGLGSLVGCVYTFGFVLMCPQLYLNYKLKSVAHLPWRQMTYKFLNTIIDDLFAFVIKMPTLHRLSVFRDDAVFLILIYQRWIYPVDKQRVNEFGFSDAPPEEAAAAVEGAPEAPALESAGTAPAAQSSGRKDATVKQVAVADAGPTPVESSGDKTKST